MAVTQENNKRIAKNAIALYIRMGLSLIVSLYTSRIVLLTLGVVDYGIYGIVGSVLAMMGFLNSSMSGATSRYITYSIGKGDKENMNHVFSSAFILHIGIALIILILAETLGLWFLENKLVIPEERMPIARIVYQFSVIASIVTITQVPFNAAIISHEHMGVYAYVEIIHVILRLLIVYLLILFSIDKLLLYSVLVLCVEIIVAFIYRFYCIRHFTECKIKWKLEKKIIRPMFSFFSLDLYGNACASISIQSINFLINIFFGVTFNAAGAIANKVSNVVSSFSYNIVTAFRPQIIKQYAQNEIGSVNRLVKNTLMCTCLLFACMAIPLLIELPFVMKLWLVDVPDYAVLFCRLILIQTMIDYIASPCATAIHATGVIRNFSFVTGTILLLNIPIIWILYRMNYPVETAYYVSIFTTLLRACACVLIMKIQIPLIKIREYIFMTLKTFLVIGFSLFITWICVKHLSADSLIRLMLDIIINFTILSATSYALLLDKDMRIKLRTIISNRFTNLKKGLRKLF